MIQIPTKTLDRIQQIRAQQTLVSADTIEHSTLQITEQQLCMEIYDKVLLPNVFELLNIAQFTKQLKSDVIPISNVVNSLLRAIQINVDLASDGVTKAASAVAAEHSSADQTANTLEVYRARDRESEQDRQRVTQLLREATDEYTRLLRS